MKFVCYTGWEQLPDSANELFATEEKTSLFLSRPWFENLTTAALDKNESMLLACVMSGSNIMAMLPLMQCGSNTLFSLKHRYTSLYCLFLTEHHQQEVLRCLSEGLRQLPIKALLLEPVADDDCHLNEFQHFMTLAGFHCEFTFRHYNWIYRVQGQSYKDYMAARPSKLRNTISRKKRKLEREHDYDIQLFTSDDVVQKMSDYYAVYNASWKASEQYVGFLNGIVAGFSKLGWSRLAILYVNEQPVAAQLWFVAHRKANIFRLSYDEAWRKYSVGSILTSYLMEYVIDVDKVEEIDFLTGNDTYKQDWMSDRRERFALSCIKNVETKGRFELFVESLKSMLKKQV